jgi:DNA invertase Pin-like site-specific DNA recombinase
MTPRPRKHTKPTSGYAVAYRRVSTDEQRESGLGLEAQTAAIEVAGARYSLQVRATYTDAGLSGALPLAKRPGLLAALSALQRGDVLLTAKRDRLGRDVVNVAMIESAAARKGARVLSAAGEGTDNDDPTGQLMRRMIDAFSEYERLLIGARTSAALRAKADRAERYSHHLPYGYRLAADGRTLDPNPAERDMLLLMKECRIALSLSWREMAETLNREGYTTRTGQPWTLHNARAAFLTSQRNQSGE